MSDEKIRRACSLNLSLITHRLSLNWRVMMLKRVSMLALALLFVVNVSNVHAQQSAAKQPKTPAKKAGAEEADPLAEVRRITAVSLVNTLADDARMFHDPILRARVQARAADALWETERERATLL